MVKERKIDSHIIEGKFVKRHNLLILMCDDHKFRFLDGSDIDIDVIEPLQILTSGKPEVMRVGRLELNLVVGDSQGWINIYRISSLLDSDYYPFDYYKGHEGSVCDMIVITGVQDFIIGSIGHDNCVILHSC